MATAMTADQLIAALKKWKVPYREYSGWRTRTRPGGLVDVAGIVNHHTGGGSASASYLEFLFVTGRPEDGIPGPLCNTATAPDGILHLGAIGRANHAGSGSSVTLAHVRAEDYNGYKAELQPGPDNVNGNPVYYGNEIIYTGTVPPTDAAYRTSVLYNAAVCDFHGWSALSGIGHREHTNRKDDPGKFTMYGFRSDLATVLRVGPDVTWSGKTPIPPEDDVALTPEQAQDIAEAGWLANQFAVTGQFKKQLDRVEAFLNTAAAKDTALAAGVAAVQAAVGALQASLVVVDQKVDGLWGTQIADVFTPESGDTSAASTLLTYGPQRVLQQVQPQLAALDTAVANLTTLVEALSPPPEPPPEPAVLPKASS